MTEEESEEFKRYLMEEVPGGVERFEWVRELEDEHNVDPRGFFTSAGRLYSEAMLCYVHQCYHASVAIAVFTIEIHLKTNLHSVSPPHNVKLYDMIEKVRKDKVIPDEFADRLDRLREMRNQIGHPYNFAHIGMLGLYKNKGKPRWGPSKKELKKLEDGMIDRPRFYSLTPQKAAEEAIECLLILNKEYPFKIRVEEQTEKEDSPSPLP
jgi:hypothetical protein